MGSTSSPRSMAAPTDQHLFLYRNQFLTSIEDAKAEVAYQVKQVPQDVDRADAISLMADAHTACQKWFDLIPSVDIDEGLNVMRSEGAGSR